MTDGFGSTDPLTYPDGSVVDRPAPHRGLDLEAPVGTPVRAPAPGLVVRVGYAPEAGHYAVLRHAGGYQTHYYHLDRPACVAVGQRVRRGQRLGLVGSSGFASGPHLHLGLYLPGPGYLDPLAYLWLPDEDDLPPEVELADLVALRPKLERLGHEGPDAMYGLRVPRKKLGRYYRPDQG